MNEKTEPEKEYPYIDRPMWLYSRSSDKKILALMQQMHELLEEAQRRSYTVVGTSQDMGTGRSMARMGLQQFYYNNQHQEKRFGGSKKGIRFSKKFFETHRKPHGYWVPVISVTKDKWAGHNR